jgi:hypothetical protein
MRKIALLIIALLAVATIAFAQNQTINGNLHVSNTSGGSLRIGKIGDIGNKAVPVGGLAAQYNLDFTGYRDVAVDQIGTRIAALRYNRHLDNSAFVQKTALAFYTNPSGINTGVADLVERMRITPDGNVGIGTNSPRVRLDVGDLTQNCLKSVLGRLGEGDNEGDGTYLGVRSYRTQPINGESLINVKSFSLESKFYGLINSSINFYRGGSKQGGSLGISVYDGREIARFYHWGLNVAGTIRAKEVKIEATGWADFVFGKEYALPSLSDVEKHINEKQHLPGIPSEKEVLENGVNVVDMQAKLLQKIEELTLYVIGLKKENEGLQKRVQQLEENQP